MMKLEAKYIIVQLFSPRDKTKLYYIGTDASSSKDFDSEEERKLRWSEKFELAQEFNSEHEALFELTKDIEGSVVSGMHFEIVKHYVTTYLY